MAIKLDNFFDELIGGGLQEEIITTVYGPPGSGKSTLCFQYIVATLQQGKQVIYIDTEGGFSVERLHQIDPEIELQDILVFSPKSFEEQQRVLFQVSKLVKGRSQGIGLIIIDSLVMLYRLKIGDAPQRINAELGEQLRLLAELARLHHLPVLVTNQMYTNFETKEKRLVGGQLIEYWSKAIVELEKDEFRRFATLKKHQFRPAGACRYFNISSEGIQESD